MAKGSIIAYTRVGCAESVRLKQMLERLAPEVLEISLTRFPNRMAELQRLNLGTLPEIPCVVFNEQVIGGVEKLDELEAEGVLRSKVKAALNTVHFEARVPLEPLKTVKTSIMLQYSEKQLELDLLVSGMMHKQKGVPKKRMKVRKGRAGKSAGGGSRCFRVGDAMEWIKAKYNLEKEATQTLFKDIYDSGHFATLENGRDSGKGMNTLLTFQADMQPFVLNKTRLFNGVARPANVIATEMLHTLQQILDTAAQKKLDIRSDATAIATLPETMLFRHQSLELQQADLADIAEEAMLATFLNLHNCLTFHMFLEVGVPKTALQRTKCRNSYCYAVGKETFTMDDMLHGILRCNRRQKGKSKSQFFPGDPRLRLCASGRLQWNCRIHFGLASIAGVPSPPVIFNETTVLDDLEWLAYVFCGRHAKVDTETLDVELPDLFEEYQLDFGRTEKQTIRWVAEYLPPETSTQLRALLKLNKSDVIYTNLEAIALADAPSPRPDSVTAVDYSNSNLEAVPPFTNWDASRVLVLNLSRNSILDLTEGFSQFSSLTHLFLSHNQLTELPNCLGDIRTLTTLDVSYNNLTAIPSSVTLLENLKNLYAASNFVSSLPEAMKDISTLKSLNLAGNLLGVLPEWLSEGFPRLEQLDVSSNQISKMPTRLPPSLVELYLNNNSLSALDRDIFQNSASLEVVDLSSNQIAMLPSGMQRLKALVTLNVASNRLTSIQIARTLPALTRLYCMRNPLTDLPASACLSASGPLAHWKRESEQKADGQDGADGRAVARRMASGPARHKLLRRGSTITDLIMTGSSSSVPKKSKGQLSTLNLRELVEASGARIPPKRTRSAPRRGSLPTAEESEKAKGEKEKETDTEVEGLSDSGGECYESPGMTRRTLAFRSNSIQGLVAKNDGYVREDGSTSTRTRTAVERDMGDNVFLTSEFVIAPTEFVYLSSFKGQPHTTFVADDPNYGYIIASVLHEPVERPSTNVWEPSFYYTALVHCIQGTKVCCIPQETRLKKKTIAKGLQRMARVHLGIPRLQEVNHEAFESLLVDLEERLCVSNHKFGVLYAKPGQKDEEEFYCNEHGSAEFEEFLGLLGEKVALRDWNGFDGGLDTVGDRTGTHTYYTERGSSNILFHISTYLPFKATDPQQLERKRHIGNDVVVLVFADSDDLNFDPGCVASQFNSVFIVVCKDPSSTPDAPKYKVNVSSKAAIGVVKPYLPKDPVFDASELRSFILEKSLMAEQAAWTHMPTFASAIKRARAIYLEEIFDDLSCTGKFKNKFGRKRSL